MYYLAVKSFCPLIMCIFCKSLEHTSYGPVLGYLWYSGTAEQLVNRSSDRSCTRGMIHNKIHLCSSIYPRPRIVSVQNRGLKSCIYSIIHLVFLQAITYRDIQTIATFVSCDFLRCQRSLYLTHWITVTLGPV